MKLITHSLTTISDGSEKIEQALGEAATEIASQVGGLPSKVTGLLVQMAKDFQEIAVKLAELPSLLDPQPMVSPLPQRFSETFDQIEKICIDAAQIPGDLAAQVADVTPVSVAVSDAIQALAALPNQLLSLVPSVPDKLKPLTDLAGMAQIALDRSDGCKGMAADFLTHVTPMTAELKSVSLALQKLEQKGVNSDLITSPLRQKESDLQGEIGAQFDQLQQEIQALKGQLMDDLSEMREVVSGVEVDLMAVLIEAKEMVQSAVTQGLSPLLAGKAQVIAFQEKVQAESQHCTALFDQANEALLKLVEDLKAVIDSVRTSLDEVGSALEEAGQDAQVLVDKSLEPIALLEETSNACMDAIDHVVVVVGEQVEAVKLALDDISLEADNTKSALQELPEKFDPVREFITTAANEIENIRSQVSDFVEQALGALSTASSHLGQAESLCDTAIDVCTKHMASAPPLAIAKSLYVGVKASFPTVQASIDSAETLVKNAGKTANALMDQAQAVVLGLNPVLDLVLEKLQEAIDALVSLLKQLQLGIVTAKDALDALLEKLQASVDELREQLNSLLETVKAHAHKFIDDIQIQASVAGIVQKLHDFSEPVLAAADEKLDASSGSVAGFVKRAQADIADAVDAFDLQIDQLLGLIDAAYEAGQSAGDSLNQQLDSVHSAWEALAAQAQAQVDQTSTHVDELIHQTLSDVAKEVGIEWEPT